jgi:hypothetical protein
MEEIILFGLFVIIYILLSINSKSSFSGGGKVVEQINNHSISPEVFLRRRQSSFNSNKYTQNRCYQKNNVIYSQENLF